MVKYNRHRHHSVPVTTCCGKALLSQAWYGFSISLPIENSFIPIELISSNRNHHHPGVLESTDDGSVFDCCWRFWQSFAPSTHKLASTYYRLDICPPDPLATSVKNRSIADVNILPIFPQLADDGKRDDERDTTPFLSAFQSRFYNCGDFACN